jgi:hypothetical protein
VIVEAQARLGPLLRVVTCMDDSTTNTTRASLLKRIALLAGGVVGVGVAAQSGAAATDAPVRKVRMRTLVLYGREWRLHRPGVQPGTRPTPTDVAVPLGRIVDRKQRELGTFRAAAMPGLAGAFQLHTFDLADGTILGIGASKLDEGSYAIVGGTGRYAGASGTYTARQSLREQGGDGTAEFTLNLKAWEA